MNDKISKYFRFPQQIFPKLLSGAVQQVFHPKNPRAEMQGQSVHRKSPSGNAGTVRPSKIPGRKCRDIPSLEKSPGGNAGTSLPSKNPRAEMQGQSVHRKNPGSKRAAARPDPGFSCFQKTVASKTADRLSVYSSTNFACTLYSRRMVLNSSGSSSAASSAAP